MNCMEKGKTVLQQMLKNKSVMSESFLFCRQCGAQNNYMERVSFRAECQKCFNDLHVCKNCLFYDESSYNECRESSAERVADKEKSNLCEYFKPSSQAAPQKTGAEDLRAQAEALFKKKK